MAKKTKHYITAEGLKKLQDELEHLKTTKAAEIAARLKEALSYGDLRENAEYQSAREAELLNDSRIREIEEEIMSAELITKKHKASDTIEMGSSVTLRNVTHKQDLEVVIVGSTEMDPFEHKISNESPLGNALIGRKVGDKFSIEAPAGEVKFEIKAVL